MTWYVCLIAALIIYTAACISGIAAGRKKNRKWLASPINILIAATFSSAFLLFIPIFFEQFQLDPGGPGKAFFIAIQGALQVFSLDGDFGSFQEALSGIDSQALHFSYSLFGAFLHFIAPLLGLGFILSFFKNASAYQKYFWGYFRDRYVFSELNQRSLALAESCLKHNPKALIIFTDVFGQDQEKAYELAEEANRIGGICFKKDILSINFKLQHKKSKMLFFIIGEDDSENIKHSLALIDAYKDNPNLEIYVFSVSKEAELLIGAAASQNTTLKIRRINEVQALVYNYLYTNSIFGYAEKNPDGEAILSIVIVGLGQYGTEMLKAVLWCGQMDGYHLKIRVFDSDPDTESKFTAQCPELMQNNGDLREGEGHYELYFDNGIDVKTAQFADKISKISDAGLVFVATGNDELNIETAIQLRILFTRLNSEYSPQIQAVVHSSEKTEVVKERGLQNYKGDSYGISFMGDIKTIYSYEAIFNSELEQAALARHLKWCNKVEEVNSEIRKFYNFEFCYRSSVASAIHAKLKVHLGIAGAAKAVEQRWEEEKQSLRQLEHRRWNVYMRTEGYCYGPKRNDMAKIHPSLVPFDQLPLSEQEKDDD